MVNNNYLLVFSCLFALPAFSAYPTDPFSRIEVVSDSALCKPASGLKNIVHLTYRDNVRVSLADGSTITATTMFVELATQTLNKSSQRTNEAGSLPKNAQQIKKITFSGPVRIEKDDTVCQAKTASIIVARKICFLKGGVVITKHKKGVDTAEFETKSNAASFNMETKEINLVGCRQQPVHTTLDMQRHFTKNLQKDAT